MRGKRAKPGDVIELDVGGAPSYVLYIGRHPEYGDAVVVGCDGSRLRPTDAGFDAKKSYVAFFPVGAAVAQRLATVVGHVMPPEQPKRLRRPGGRSGNRIDTWVVSDESGDHVTTTLSSEELAFPIAVIWNHAMLVQRILTDWHPERVG